MRIKSSFLTFTFLVLFCFQTSLANNNLFLPGDAFFPTELTKADIEQLQKTKDGQLSFEYSSLGGYQGAFCGYAGYRTALLPVADNKFANNLTKAYERIREFEGRVLIETEWEDGKTTYKETNGVQVLFYNGDFNMSKHALGLRYNENWIKEVAAFGHPREHARLCPLLQSRNAIANSWRDGDLVPALKAKLPSADKGSLKGTLKEPIVMDSGIKAIVIPASVSLDDIFNRASESNLFVVDSNAIKEMHYSKGKWQEVSADESGLGGGSGGGVFKD